MKNEFSLRENGSESKGLESFIDIEKEDLFVELANQIVAHIEEITKTRDNTIDVETKERLNKVLDQVQPLLGQLIVKMSSAFDQYKGREIPDEVREQTANQIVSIEHILTEAEKPLEEGKIFEEAA